MKEFYKRVGIFAILNAILIGLSSLVSPLTFDTCVIVCSLFCIVLGFGYELYDSIKKDHKPSMAEMFGASVFGSLVAAFIIVGITLLCK